MDRGSNRHSFAHRTTVVDGRPYVFIESLPEQEAAEAGTAQKERPAAQRTAHESRGCGPSPVSLFGHQIGGVLSGAASHETAHVLDDQLGSALDAVRQKLERARASVPRGERSSEGQTAKYQRFIDERNAAQEELFRDAVRYHRDFGTGLGAEDLWSLHRLMKNVAEHEEACSSGERAVDVIECRILGFLRRKTSERAWTRNLEYLESARIPFPIPPSMQEPDDPERNQRIREDMKRSHGDEFLTFSSSVMADLILANIPTWVYSYPASTSYLWQLTALQAVAAALAAAQLSEVLAVWEEGSSAILAKVEQEYGEQILALQRRGEAAAEIAELLSVSNKIRRLSEEEIPARVWHYVSQKLSTTRGPVPGST